MTADLGHLSPEGLVTAQDGRARCGWCGTDPGYVAYHDHEWGVPVHDDVRLFEKLCLEGFQAGLSWLTILRKRDAFRAAFAGFVPKQVATFGDDDIARLLADAGIVRHRGKIEAVIGNARAYLDLVADVGSLATFVWGFAPDRHPIPRRLADVPATSPESVALSKALKGRGFRFVGPTTAYAFMQSMGLVNDHLEACAARDAGDRLTGRPVAALVREPSPRLAEAELTHVERTPIDPALAREQHAGYIRLLERLGLDVVHVASLPDHPDGVFVEDAVVVVDDVAIMTRPGAVSRRGEIATVRDALRDRGLAIHDIRPPATLDGGDVLQIGRTVYVGQGGRSNAEGAAQLADALTPLGRTVERIPVRGVLHLKTAATALPDGTVVVWPGAVPKQAFGNREIIAAAEPSGADVLLVGETVVVSSSAPRTAARIAARGFTVECIDIGELERAEAGVTCLSVLLRPADRSMDATTPQGNQTAHRREVP